MCKMAFNLQRFAFSGTSSRDNYKNFLASNLVYGNGGNDSLVNSADDVTLSGGAGNDTILNIFSDDKGGDSVSIFGGAGNDFLQSTDGYDVTLNGGDGADTIKNVNGDEAHLSGGKGNDSIYSSNANKATILGGDNNDTIKVYRGKNSKIDGGDGADVISLSSSAGTTTVIGGTGDDTIYGDTRKPVILVYRKGDGNDFVYNYKATDKLSLSSGIYYTQETVGSNVVVSVVGGGEINLVGASGKKINIVGGTATVAGPKNVTVSSSNVSVGGTSYGDRIVNNNGKNVTIVSGAGNDTIHNKISSHSTNSNASIVAGDGNDSVYNEFGSGATVLTGNGKDSIFDASWYTFIDGGADDDSINANNYAQTIHGGTGNDVIIFSGSYGSLNGGADNDTIKLSGTNTTVKGGAGNDYISLSSSSSLNTFQFGAGDGFDTVKGIGSTDTISLSGGYYTIETIGTAKVISLISGVGSLTLQDAKNTNFKIVGGTATTAGPKNITITSSSMVSGTSYNDSITNQADKVTINAAAGNDSIVNRGSNVSINGGAGADVLNLDPYYFGSQKNITLTGGSGNDTFVVDPYNSNTISAVITDFTKDDVFVYDSDFDDSGNKKLSYSISGGNMVIQNNKSTNGNTIAPTFIVTLKGVSSLSQISAAKYYRVTTWHTGSKHESTTFGELLKDVTTTTAGQTISNRNDNTVISTGAGNDSVYNNATNVTISTGGGNDTVNVGYSNKISISTGAGNDSVWGNNNYGTINTGDDADTIVGNHYSSHLNGGDGGDVVSITSYSYNTVDGGAGNDTLVVGNYVQGHTDIYATGISINGGSGADSISLRGSNSTIMGGIGNDSITLSGSNNVLQYGKGDGNDMIWGWDSSDSITISGGSKWTKSTSGQNVILKIANSGNVTLVGANGKTINVYPSTGYTEENTPQDVILKFMKGLDDTNNTGELAMDDAVKACSEYNDMQDLIDKLYKDCKTYVEGDSVNGWEKFLLDKCDIDLTNSDTGAITGKDAGGAVVKTATSVIPEPNKRDTSFSKDSFTTNGVTFKIGTFNNQTNKVDEKNFNSLTSDEKFIWQSMYSNWSREGLNLIDESYGYSFADSENKTSTIYIDFDYDTNALAWTWTPYYNTSTLRAKDILIGVNMNIYKNFSASDLNGEGSYYGTKQEYLDRTLTHEMVHAIMAAKVKKFGDLSVAVKEGTAELVKGIDDTRTSTIKNVANDPTALKYYLNASANNYQDRTDNMYAAGYIMLRYLAKQASSGGDKNNTLANAIQSTANTAGVSVKGNLMTLTTQFKDKTIDLAEHSAPVTKIDASKLSKALNIYGTSAANSIKGGSGADKIFAGAGNDTVTAGAGADEIFGGKGADLLKGEAGNDNISGGAGNDTLDGGAGNDTLNGGANNDTLTGGAGADLFIYRSGDGNDVIADFSAAQKDKLQIVNGKISKTRTSGKDLIYTIGSNTLTLKNAKDQKVSVEYVDDTRVYSGWFTEDDNNFITDADNFATADSFTPMDALSELSVQTYSVGDIQTLDYTALAQKAENRLTYGYKK